MPSPDDMPAHVKAFQAAYSILLDLVDHKYLFRYEYVNIGSPGRCHDAYVYRQSGLADMAEEPLFQAPTTII
ncbi:hypothetical protein HPB49_002922 [Dermacentor silvarum]|uniref:Uncharacterized protein n=1 Tax=Dermacentor silvarum TaxID=543639 RepID=A0ACB8DTD9_DERSI|nr:hypothetical protein HPB49_002922 [Dermacentor silvarum]